MPEGTSELEAPDDLGATAAPRRSGYGREFIERALPYQLNAVTKLEFTPDGVRCSVELPLERSNRVGG